MAQPLSGIDLHSTLAGHIFDIERQRKPFCTQRRGSNNIFDVRATPRARQPRYTVDFTLDAQGEPATALCVDRWGEQCRANEFRGGCYHVAAALLRFYRHRAIHKPQGNVLPFPNRHVA